MGKKITIAYLIFCGVIFLALVSLLGVRIKLNWDRNLAHVTESFGKLEAASSSILDRYSGFESSSYLDELRDYLDSERRLLLLAIYSSGQGMQYLHAKNQEYVDSPDTIETTWQGKLAYKSRPIGSHMLSLPFGARGDMHIDGLYTIIGREDFFPIIKETFIILFIFFIATCVVLLVAPLESAKAPPDTTTVRTVKEPRLEQEAGNLFSPNTGLSWSEHLPQKLKSEIHRAATLDLDLVFGLIRIDHFGGVTKREIVYAKIAKTLLETYTFQDLIFEYKEDSFAILVPDMDLDQGILSLDAFKKKIAASPTADQKITVSVGLSSRAGRLVNGATLLAESARALKKAQFESTNMLMAFRANPDKYRDVVSRRT